MQQQMTAARGINVALGIWLFISAFLWRHSQGQFTNTWVVGALCVVFALLAIWAPWARYLNTILSIWLFVSAWAIPALSVGTVWNNVLVSVAILIVSLLPTVPAARGVRGPRAAPRL
ncbi:SPW repeat domain-containing protein [Sorangium sp. So ce1153]|uniref:SPW repeat domain-containing protein n=1 Tax=Sorangium sp. So ce1153 TaxID=3133333 RepID=UPI003F623B25